MAKVQIKSEKLTPFGGIFSIMEQFDFIGSTSESSLSRCFKQNKTHHLKESITNISVFRAFRCSKENKIDHQ